jgi:hypothetical protein
MAASHETSLFDYNTSVQWQTFNAGMVVDVLRDAGLRIGVLFLAIAVIDGAMPYAFTLLRAGGRARFGRSAAIAAVTAVGAFAAVRGAMHLLALRFPGAADVSIDVPNLVAVPWPSLLAIGEAVYDAVMASAIVLSIVVSLRALKRRQWIGDAILVAAMFGAALDAGATPAQMPLMLFRSLLLAATVWAIGRFVLNGNALAWPAAIFLAIALQNAASLMQSRADLRMNAMIIAVVAIGALIWIAFATPSEASVPESHA